MKTEETTKAQQDAARKAADAANAERLKAMPKADGSRRLG